LPALADAIGRLLRDPVERRRLATEAQRFAGEHDVETTARELGALYESVRR